VIDRWQQQEIDRLTAEGSIDSIENEREVDRQQQQLQVIDRLTARRSINSSSKN
jgi:hypothetical protein